MQFEKVIADNKAIIVKICRAYSTEDDFDDLYQEVLVNIWRSLKNFEGRSKISTWLYRLALNTALGYQRKEKKHKGHQREGDEYLQIEDTSGYDQEKEEQLKNLYAALKQLRPDDRSLMILYLDEKKYDEIAEIMGITQVNVGVKINRIKKQLFTILSSYE